MTNSNFWISSKFDQKKSLNLFMGFTLYMTVIYLNTQQVILTRRKGRMSEALKEVGTLTGSGVRSGVRSGLRRGLIRGAN